MFNICIKFSNKIIPISFDDDNHNYEDTTPSKNIYKLKLIEQKDNEELISKEINASIIKNNFTIWSKVFNVKTNDKDSYYDAIFNSLEYVYKYNIEEIYIETYNFFIIELLQNLNKDKNKNAIKIYNFMKKFNKINIGVPS